MRDDDALTVLRAVGVETGGANVQFAVDPRTGRRVDRDEPAASRSSALASKATASRSPRWPPSWPSASPSTRSATRSPATPPPPEPDLRLRGRQGAPVQLREVRGRPGADHPHEVGGGGHGHRPHLPRGPPEGLPVAGDRPRRPRRPGKRLRRRAVPSAAPAPLAACGLPRADRLAAVERALRLGRKADEVAAASDIDPWFVDGMARIVVGAEVAEATSTTTSHSLLGGQAPRLLRRPAGRRRRGHRGRGPTRRRALGVEPVYRSVDTAPASSRPPPPTTWLDLRGETISRRPAGAGWWCARVGAQPDRPGGRVRHGLRPRRPGAGGEAGHETVMVNCNPETVPSTTTSPTGSMSSRRPARTSSRCAAPRRPGASSSG